MWPLESVLREKYEMQQHEAQGLAHFLLPMYDAHTLPCLFRVCESRRNAERRPVQAAHRAQGPSHRGPGAAASLAPAVRAGQSPSSSLLGPHEEPHCALQAGDPIRPKAATPEQKKSKSTRPLPGIWGLVVVDWLRFLISGAPGPDDDDSTDD